MTLSGQYGGDRGSRFPERRCQFADSDSDKGRAPRSGRGDHSGNSRPARSFRRSPSIEASSVASKRASSCWSLRITARTAASTASRPSSVSSTMTPRRSWGSGSRRTRPRRSSRSDAARDAGGGHHQPAPQPARGEAMGRSGDAQGAQHPDLAATQPELAEDFLLTPGEQGPDPAETGGRPGVGSSRARVVRPPQPPMRRSVRSSVMPRMLTQ